MTRRSLPSYAVGAAILGLAFWFFRPTDPSVRPQAEVPATEASSSVPPVVGTGAIEATGIAHRAGLRAEYDPSIEDGRSTPCTIVVTSDGRPVEGCFVRVEAAPGLVETSTDVFGRAEVPASNFGRILVWREGIWPSRHEVSPLRGVVEIDLAEFCTLEGTVLIEGAPATSPIQIVARSSAAMLAASDVPPDIVRQSLRSRLERGRFRFVGLPKEWRGTLVWDPGYVLEGEDRNAGLRRYVRSVPQEIVLRLVREEVLTGRVVDSEGAPVPEAPVECHYSDRPNYSSLSARADDEGTFVFTLPHSRLEEVELRVASRVGAGGRTLFLPAPRGGSPVWDIGDVRLRPTRTVRILTVDAEGRPVGGAVPRLDGSPLGVVTDPAGSSLLALPPDEVLITVGAPGCVEATALIAADAHDVQVHLGRSSDLRIALDGGGENSIVCLSGEAPWFPRGRWTPRCEELLDGTELVGTFRGPDGAHVLLRPGRAGASVSGLVPGVDLTCAVLDAHRLEMTRALASAGEPGERRSVVLDVSAPSRDVEGLVLDRSGRSVSGARVYLRGPHPSPQTWTRSDETGRFRFLDVRGRGRLWIEHADHAPRLFELPEENGKDLVVVLDEGRAVRVRVVDRNGGPVEGCFVEGRHEGGPRPMRAQALGGGSYLLSHVPDDSVSLLVRKDAFVHTEVLNGFTEHIEVCLSDGVAVEARIAAHVELHDAATYAVALLPSNEDGPVYTTLLDPGDRRLAMTVPPGLYDLELRAWRSDNGEETWQPLTRASVVVGARDTLVRAVLE